MSSNPVLPEPPNGTWRPVQAYLFAAVCLLVGLPIGYLIRGSAQPSSANAAISVPNNQAPATPPGMAVAPEASRAPESAPKQMPSLEDMKRMADKQVEPMLAELKKKPNDPVLLNKVALYYKAAHQFDHATEYFQKSLQSDPKNIAVRDDYASCLFYSGHVDEALAQLQKSLSYDPKHAGTLFNLGMIKWRGKGDADGAVAAWQKLLDTNPNFDHKQAIERLIQEATKSKGQPAERQKS